MSYYLGIDIGTSGTKSLIMSADGAVLATATAEHGISSPKPGWSEQHPQDWWKSTVAAVREVVATAGINPAEVAGIGLSGQMHGLIVTDAAGKVLRPAIIWNDQRTVEQARMIEDKVGGRKKLIDLVGNVAMTSFTLTKLLWVRQHEPRLFDKIKHMLLPKDYIRLRLTGEYVGDVSDMSGTLMLDQRKRDWSGKILSLFQIDKSILPPLVESHEVTGGLNAAAAEELQLPVGVPVVGGGGDQAVGAIGNGIVADGLMSATLGTSGVVYVHSKQYKTDPAGSVQTFCSSVAGEWCMFGCVLAAGGSMQWFRKVLGTGETEQAAKKHIDPYILLLEQAIAAPPGCEGLFFLPYLTGERTPHADPLAKACWIGMHSRTTRNELIRSVMEGSAFAMNDAVTAICDRGIDIKQIRLSGGGSRFEFSRQMQADVYGIPCATVNSSEGPAFGAAILAAVGTGRFKNVPQACRAAVKVVQTIKPSPKLKKLYQKHYAEYRRLYPALKNEFVKIAELG